MSNNPYSYFFRNGGANPYFRKLQSDYRFEVGSLSGTSDPTIPFPSLFSPVAAGTTGYAKVWDGNAWVKKPVKVWTGSAWVIKPVKHWNGSAWVTTL